MKSFLVRLSSFDYIPNDNVSEYLIENKINEYF